MPPGTIASWTISSRRSISRPAASWITPALSRLQGAALIYNRALERLQGYEPPVSYLLGRGWRQGRHRGSSAFDRLAQVPQAGTVTKQTPISGKSPKPAVQWVRRVKTKGTSVEVLPQPSVPELYPNGSNITDAPWHNAKRPDRRELEELTQLWWVSAQGRRQHTRPAFSGGPITASPRSVWASQGPSIASTLARILSVEPGHRRFPSSSRRESARA